MGEPDIAPALFALPPRVAAKLDLFCRMTGDEPEDVIADALELHFDALDRLVTQAEVAALVAEFQGTAR
jgi:hypothetical protein